jgi:neurofibromin 1
MFLRFISPALVSPESIDMELPKESGPTIKKGLLVVAKVIQHLANNMFFAKQNSMSPLNEFLKAHIVVVTRFLSDLNVCHSFLPSVLSNSMIEIRC